MHYYGEVQNHTILQWLDRGGRYISHVAQYFTRTLVLCQLHTDIGERILTRQCALSSRAEEVLALLRRGLYSDTADQGPIPGVGYPDLAEPKT